MTEIPTERVRRSLTPVGQISIGTVQKDGEDAYKVKVESPNGDTDTVQRPATAGKISIPARFRGDEDEYIVEREEEGIRLVPVADDHNERNILLLPEATNTSGQQAETA